MSMYTGKEPCAGCGKTGKQEPRYMKGELCYPCQKIYAAGKAELTYRDKAWVRVFQHYHAFYNKEVNGLAHELLKALHVPVNNAKGIHSLRSTYGNNGEHYRIPEETLEPLKKFMNALDSRLTELKKQEDELPTKAKEAVQAEYDKVYNEGVEAGRNLLFQLESGGISMDDFAARLRYSKL